MRKRKTLPTKTFLTCLIAILAVSGLYADENLKKAVEEAYLAGKAAGYAKGKADGISQCQSSHERAGGDRGHVSNGGTRGHSVDDWNQWFDERTKGEAVDMDDLVAKKEDVILVIPNSKKLELKKISPETLKSLGGESFESYLNSR